MEKTKKLIFSALMLGLSTVLSIYKFPMPMGGSITVASMVPVVITALRFPLPWALSVAFLHGVIQLLLGLGNLAYATNWFVALIIILFDYLVAFGVLGFAGIFKKKLSLLPAAVLGTALTFFLRFLCHFITGWFVWDALFPNELSMISPVYSFCYNGAYMLPELVISVAVLTVLLKFSAVRKLLVQEQIR